MASTKQMQARAKAKRKLQEQILSVAVEMTKVSTTQANLANKVSYRLISTITDVADIHAEFCNVYRQQGDLIYNLFDNGVTVERQDSLIASGTSKWIEVYYEGKVAGFVHLGKHSSTDTYWLELMYVKPEFEGLGIATYTYKHMVEHFSVDEISLTFHRIAGRCAYWNSLGFVRFHVEPGTGGTRNALAKVSMIRERGCPLTEVHIKDARNYLNTGKMKVSA